MEGVDLGKRDSVLVEGAPHRVAEVRRMQMEGEAMTLTVEAEDLSSG